MLFRFTSSTASQVSSLVSITEESDSGMIPALL
jgi:hypothetical protein